MHPSVISYAENHEDVMLRRAPREAEKGLYVDTGAADREKCSVTCAFQERGWAGINFAPSDEYFGKLRKVMQLRPSLAINASLKQLKARPQRHNV